MAKHFSYEKIKTEIFDTAEAASIKAAQEIASLIRSKSEENETCVLGLATGSTPKTVYSELVRLHKEEGLSFKNVVTFNLDEYYPIHQNAVQSYFRFMNEQLFDHVDIPADNCHIPDGAVSIENIAAHCKAYEQKIDEYGGIDLQLLGIGTNGHIGFNEPGSFINSSTRLMMLDHSTRVSAISDFSGNLSYVPKKAITLGVKKILEAKRIILLAFGEQKSEIVRDAVEGLVTEEVPASYLQTHADTCFFLDEAAAKKITRIKTPWLLDTVIWNEQMTKKAVIHLSQMINKPILQLTNKDYNDNGMSDLLAQSGQAYDINIRIFSHLQHTITGWPGGKPNADDRSRPERAEPPKKRVIIFSPHPDDDIISMGGTFQRLVDQGHDVHVAYQTSGNIAVADDEALRFIEFVTDFNEKFNFEKSGSNDLYLKAKTFLESKKTGEKDIEEVRFVKGLIRKGEAKATCRFVGVPEENIHFLNLPFYETGMVEKNPIGKEDISIISNIIDKIQPHQIFAAGDLADPHGTHKVCLDGIIASLRNLKNESFMKDCWLWLYSGAWAEWEVHEIEMAVPMSPDQVLKKRHGIFKHQSQKDGVVFQGNDSREFWQRAEDRNQQTANFYNQLGLAQYAAMEAFVRRKII
jgi:glucosamine-6-phosphate deaminase